MTSETVAETQATSIEDAPDGTVKEDAVGADTGTRSEGGGSPEDGLSGDPASDTDASPQDAEPNADAASTPLASTTSSEDAGPADTSTPTHDSAGQDPGQPYLFVDLYSGDDGRLVGNQPAWQVVANTKGFFGGYSQSVGWYEVQ